MATRAIAFLDGRNIPFGVVRYEHLEKGAEFAARATGVVLERTVKTLVAELGEKRYCLVLMPGDSRLDLKALARACGVKRAAMVDAETAQKVTGYRVGGISPFGTKQPLLTVMESRITQYDEVLVNAGQRGVMLRMAPADIAQVLGCQVAAVAR